jgi:dUTP pyrophosphatase
VRLKLLRPGAAVPRYATPGAAGLDLSAALEEAVTLAPGARALVPTGLALAIPPGYEGQVRPRSGLAVQAGVTVLNAPGTIDSDYRGEVKVVLVNLGTEPRTIHPGDRIAQLVVARFAQVAVEVAAELDPTERGAGGFGHTDGGTT